MTDGEYSRAREALIAYLKHKVDLADWHGVADAACDLRVLEAEQNGRNEKKSCFGRFVVLASVSPIAISAECGHGLDGPR